MLFAVPYPLPSIWWRRLWMTPHQKIGPTGNSRILSCILRLRVNFCRIVKRFRMTFWIPVILWLILLHVGQSSWNLFDLEPTLFGKKYGSYFGVFNPSLRKLLNLPPLLHTWSSRLIASGAAEFFFDKTRVFRVENKDLQTRNRVLAKWCP